MNLQNERLEKIKELKSVIGKDVSENHSPSLRGKLLGVYNDYALFEVVASPYDKNRGFYEIGREYKVPVNWAWNAFFY